MAEGGIVERIFGGAEGDEPETETLANGADPMAAAVAIDAARFDPELSRDAAAYLRKQAHLVDVQTEHLHEQRAVQLDHLKLRRVGERMRVAIQAFFVAVGAVIACGFIWMVWSAANDHGLVVKAFSVPPDLAARGLTGQVVAEQVLDRLAKLQAQTETMRAANTYENNWGDDLKVEIPETGVSVAEVSRYLRSLLGHETQISGDVYRTASGLTISARAGEDGADSFSGAETDWDKLVDQTAESIFSRTQPYRYSVYLATHGRAAEAKLVLQRMVDSDDADQRAWGYLGLAELQDQYRSKVPLFRLAAEQEPQFPPAVVNLSDEERVLGHDVEAVKANRLFLSEPAAARKYIAEPDRDLYTSWAHENLDLDYGDKAGALRTARKLLMNHSGRERQTYVDTMTYDAALDHNANRARMIQSSNPSVGTLEGVLGLAALEEGSASSVGHLRKSLVADIGSYGREYAMLDDGPDLAVAEARFGFLADAERLVSALPSDCYACLRARGTVASYAGDRHAADGWFAEAIRQAPDLPAAYVDRGQARFREHDLDGALADAKTAARLGPRDPDAYGLWGDVLARRREWRAAEAKYDEALRYAPAWAAARRAREEVAARA